MDFLDVISLRCGKMLNSISIASDISKEHPQPQRGKLTELHIGRDFLFENIRAFVMRDLLEQLTPCWKLENMHQKPRFSGSIRQPFLKAQQWKSAVGGDCQMEIRPPKGIQRKRRCVGSSQPTN